MGERGRGKMRGEGGGEREGGSKGTCHILTMSFLSPLTYCCSL